jgi:hypothetical protein
MVHQAQLDVLARQQSLASNGASSLTGIHVIFQPSFLMRTLGLTGVQIVLLVACLVENQAPSLVAAVCKVVMPSQDSEFNAAVQ